MTDPKPATPATDRKPCPFCGVNVPFVQDPSTKFIDSSWIEHPQNGCRIGRKMYLPEWNTRPQEVADAETIKAERARADKYEAESEQKGADLMAAESIVAEQAEEIERWKELHGNDERCIQNQFTELATLREQVRTLRDALTRLRDCDWVISLPDRMDAVRDIARAALAATEPKG